MTDAARFEASSIADKNRVVDELKLVGTYVSALGGPPNVSTRPILQIISAEYKKFGDITDAQLASEGLVDKALPSWQLKVLLRRVYALYYRKWLCDDDVVFCIAFVKVGDL